MKILAIIPARMASSRFPGKPMAKIHGVPMIGHCYLRSLLSKKLDDVYICCDDKKIANTIKKFGVKFIHEKVFSYHGVRYVGLRFSTSRKLVV